MADAPDRASGVTLDELLAALSLGIDLGMGQPMAHVQAQTLLACRLGEQLGLGEAELEVVFHASMLAWVGCHVDAHEQARWFGDDRAFKADARLVDMGRPLELAGYLARHLGAGYPAWERVRLGATVLGGGRRLLWDIMPTHCSSAADLAAGLGLPGPVRKALLHTYERWDGKGEPDHLRGDEVHVASRLLNVADVVLVHRRAGGVEAAIEVARRRSGRAFDPAVVDRFCTSARDLFAEVDDIVSWPESLAGISTPGPQLSDLELESCLEAIADFVDLKSPYTIGHSRAVADLAGAAGHQLGLPGEDARTVRRAGLVHDFGRLGISNMVWDKREALTPAERERVRLHPYLTQRMLAASPSLARLGSIAVLHHERLDGSGYPGGLSGNSISAMGRVLGAADMFRTRTESRPHRPARSAVEATAELRAEVRAGRLDGDAVDAVLRAAGHRVRRRREWPARLTAREVEVLRLLARGMSQRQIAATLVISPKTAGNHISRIYTKIGVSNRARASVFAVRHGLMNEETEPVA